MATGRAAVAGVAAAGGIGALFKSYFVPAEPANITHVGTHHHFHDVDKIPSKALEHPGEAQGTVTNSVAGLMESWTGPASPVNTTHHYLHKNHLPEVPGHVETRAENSVFGLMSNWMSGEKKA